MAMDLDIRPLAADTWADLDALFDAGGDAKWCACQFWRRPDIGWGRVAAADNRRALHAQLDDPLPPGLVAFRDGEAVGWVAVAPRGGYPRLARSRTIPQLPGDDVWVISCFVVRRTARGRGVATALLDAAVTFALGHGAGVVEGYPVNNDGAHLPPGAAYTGTAGMFERAGFTIAAPTTSRARPDRPRVVMRRRS
jgi:GNAT superfamily N-acetyltransferase